MIGREPLRVAGRSSAPRDLPDSWPASRCRARRSVGRRADRRPARSGDERIVDRLAADSELPSDVLGLVQGGPALLDRARNAVERASAADPSVVRSLTDVTLLAPIPRPPKIVCIGVNDVELA
jgi:2-keto-4-pentenoate hydratase/2-oxohepta-3-ene-1,7-dioic acid hydratase in catechol pathway